MGEAELSLSTRQLIIRSDFHFYGEASSPELAEAVAREIQDLWNAPRAVVHLKKTFLTVVFEIRGFHQGDLKPERVWENTDPRNNFFRIEETAIGNISFVDGIGSNTGYFKLDNLLHASTTAAHEYGHTLGLEHPPVTDIRGGGQPGIMFPRGTICDPDYQYDPLAEPLKPGGTLHPAKRRVLVQDIQAMRLERLSFRQGLAQLGDFSSVYHDKME